MLTSWNKLCFTTGYLEVSLSLPGSSQAPGFWPGECFIYMCILLISYGRQAHGLWAIWYVLLDRLFVRSHQWVRDALATVEQRKVCISFSMLLPNVHPSLCIGTWPYSYDTCDLGTLPNQTYDGTPAAAATGGNGGGPLSYQPGQRLSACTCPNQDHPGPTTSNGYVGRGVPEIDILEAQIDLYTSPFQGQVSQSFQVAPYNYQYQFDNSTPATSINDSSITALNSYKGSLYQQALSAVSFVDSQNYNGQNYATYGFEYWSNPSDRASGYITWYSESAQTWKITSASVGPDPISEVSSRLISEEPMVSSLINLRMRLD